MPRSVTSRNGIAGLAQPARLLDCRVRVLRLHDLVAAAGEALGQDAAHLLLVVHEQDGARRPAPPPARRGGGGRRRRPRGRHARLFGRSPRPLAPLGRPSRLRRLDDSCAPRRRRRRPRGGSANDASSAAVESRRSSSIPRARSSRSSWALMPSDSVSAVMSRDSTFAGRLSVRLKLNCPSRRRMSCSRAISMRLRSSAVALLRRQQRARGSSGGVSGVNGPRRGRRGRRWRLRPPRRGWSGSPFSC